ncbi:hypothetical protein PUN28_004491 [Cardiocondyla obscurior]|uniref:Uncharacterized protein n=1 Tax=Cardiocondyla obscurior TaxID=286306 RepID=A0AAW2GEW6_9HYME
MCNDFKISFPVSFRCTQLYIVLTKVSIILKRQL